jgi:hypothetical protein
MADDRLGSHFAEKHGARGSGREHVVREETSLFKRQVKRSEEKGKTHSAVLHKIMSVVAHSRAAAQVRTDAAGFGQSISAAPL